ncbi:MAG: rhomboid family intramembrane serine protease, partial [Rhodospirillales bacterium]|nr:rhomboid family intramembrane serine protease [Rhodospirillales bacterium]
NVPAVWVLGLWFLAQFWSGATTQADQGGVAFWAHVGGFVTGMVLVPFFKDAEVPLFGARRTQAFEVLSTRTTRRGGSVPPAGGRHGPWGPRDDDRHGPWR